MIRRPPRSTRTDTRSLHAALPGSALKRAGLASYLRDVSSKRLAGIAAQNGFRFLCGSALMGDIAAPIHQQPLPQSRSEEHTSELQSLMRTSYAVFCLKKKTTHTSHAPHPPTTHPPHPPPRP